MVYSGHFDRLALILAGVLLGASGCATVPPSGLDRARGAHAAAASDEEVARNAPEVLYEAERDLDAAERAWEDGGEKRVDHLAYLSELRVERARVVARKCAANQESSDLNDQRNRALLEARTREVDAARVEADLARKRAQEEASRAAEQKQRASELDAALENLKAQHTERGIIVTLGGALFDFGRAELKPRIRQKLYPLVTALRETPDRQLIVEGCTDSVGSDSYNVGFSQRRAEAVRGFLTENGIGLERIVAQGYGEDYPIAANETPGGRQRNRRVEVVILEPGQLASEQVRMRKLPAVSALC